MNHRLPHSYRPPALKAGGIFPLALATVMGSAHAAVDTHRQSAGDNQLEQILVTGRNLAGRTTSVGKMDVPLTETPFSVSILTQDFFTATGVKTVQDALQYSAGVNGGTYGIDTRGDWSTVRGTAPVQYVDGLKSLFGNYNNTRPNPYTLERLEILKGPASVLYGQGSLGGIINLVSKRPQAEAAGELWLQYGSFERKQAALDVTGPLDADGRWLYRLVALKRDSETQTDQVDDDSEILAPSLTWSPTDATRITLLANIQSDESGTSTQFLPWAGTILPGAYGDLDTATFVSEPDWDRYDSEQQAYTLIADHHFSDAWSLHANVRRVTSDVDYWSMWPAFTADPNDRIFPDGRTVARTAYLSDASFEATLFDVRTQLRFDTGPVSHTLLLGVDSQDATTDNDFAYTTGGTIDIYEPVYGTLPPPVTIPDLPSTTTEQLGVYLQDQIDIGNWIVATGLRYDETESSTEGQSGADTEHATTGRLGLMYAFDNGFSPYISYTESFEPITGANDQGERFDPREGEQRELGLKYQPPGSPLLFTAAAYRIEETGRLVDAPTGDPRGQVQTGKTEIDGFELELQASWEQVDLIANYSDTQTEDKTTDARLAAVPEKLFSVWATYRFRGPLDGLRFGLGVRHVGETWDGTDNKSLTTPDYTLVDGMLGYELEHWFISLNARNITDKKHLTSCLARGDCFVGERRVVTADVRYRY